MKLKPFLQGFGLFAILLTLIPIAAADFWWIRMFDYPHIQLTILTFVALVVYFIKFDVKWIKDYLFVIVLLACFLFQLYKVYPYIPHKSYEVGEAKNSIENDNSFKFYAANVLQKNKNPNILIQEIKDLDPDIILLTETDTRWMKDVSGAVSDYKYKIEIPIANTYGMLLYSKLKLKKPEKLFLVDDSIPSIKTIIKLRSGKEIMLYAIHPTPPMPQENPTSTDRDAEMLMVAKMALNRKIPVIIAGDFNDVAWSASVKLFKDISALLDIRVGRGFYNTFDATSFLMKWPLDQFFVSEEFKVIKLNTGKDIESDHLPFYVELSLEPKDSEEQKVEGPSDNQLDNANEQIQEAKEEQIEKKKEGK